jgi:glutamyl-tRNA reductase
MSVVLVGASLHDTGLDEIEHLARAGTGLATDLVGADHGIRGALVLSTCNRFEVYLDLDRFHEPVERVIATVADRTDYAEEQVANLMRVTVGTAVAQRLFAVTAGLDSMIVGEAEIAGQVRAALATAQREQTASPTLQRLLQRALRTSKLVTSSTGLGAAGRSVVSVGLDLVESRHGPVAGRRAVVYGTGSYARVAIAALRARGCNDIGVHSASGRAAEFARRHEVAAIPAPGLADALDSAQLLVSCSGQAARALTAQAVPPRRTPLPVLDLALSSDLAPDLRGRPDVDVIDLETIRLHAPSEHTSAVLAAHQIVRTAADEFEQAETGRDAAPAVVAMRAYVTGIIDEELAEVRSRLDKPVADEVTRSLTRVANTLLHTPSVRARELVRSGDLEDYAKAMHTLFGIEIPTV